jgi:hypothetical protein
MAREAQRLLDEIEQRLVALRQVLGEPGSPEKRTGADEMNTYDHLDLSRRRRPEWLRRGIVMAAIKKAGEQVDLERFEEVALAAGYRDIRAVNRFYQGKPEPALERSGDQVRLTERGRSAADFFKRWWLPRLRAGEVQWPTSEAKRMIEGEATGLIAG